MKLHEDAERLARMKQQLASSELRDRLDKAEDRIKLLEKQVTTLQSMMTKVISRISSGR